MKGLKEGEDNSAIAEQIVANFLSKIKDIVKLASSSDDTVPALAIQLRDLIVLSLKDPKNPKLPQYLQAPLNFLISSLIMSSSQRTRDEALTILNLLQTHDPALSTNIL